MSELVSNCQETMIECWHCTDDKKLADKLTLHFQENVVWTMTLSYNPECFRLQATTRIVEFNSFGVFLFHFELNLSRIKHVDTWWKLVYVSISDCTLHCKVCLSQSTAHSVMYSLSTWTLIICRYPYFVAENFLFSFCLTHSKSRISF